MLGNSGISSMPQVLGLFSSMLSEPHLYVAEPVWSNATMANPASWFGLGVSVPQMSEKRILNSYVSFALLLNLPLPESCPSQTKRQGVQPDTPSPTSVVKALEAPPVARNRRLHVCGASAVQPSCRVKSVSPASVKTSVD